MKKIITGLCVAATLVSVSSITLAGDSGFYAGVTVGQSNTGTVVSGATMTKSTDTAWGILGGYQLTKNWGAEVFYSDDGKWAATANGFPASGKVDAWGINAVGTLPLSEAFSLYGKLGYASTKTSASVVTGQDLSATHGAATYGLGGVYNVNPSIGIRFGWDRYTAAIKTAAYGEVSNDSDVYSLGAVFKF